MPTEADAIPFEPSAPRGERLLVLAPHPDDEVIACGGLLAQHVDEGRLVRVVVATDGGQAGEPAQRAEESRRALALLADGLEPEFLGFPDRQLAAHREALVDRLSAILHEWRPDLILCPSPIEFHPDHLALAIALCEAVQRSAALAADLAVARVAFFEVVQPVRPNAIVDITGVAERKYSAIAEHRSQTQVRDYVAFARGLNAYRAMTMPPSVQFAEAYWIADVPSLRTTSIAVLQQAIGGPRGVEIEVSEPALPISVIVRTKDRPELFQQALRSIRSTGYPVQIVAVNDGGAPIDADGVDIVRHEASRGRSEAANSGVRAAKHPFIAFLDDDDIVHPEHFRTLARAAADDRHAAWFSDAVSSFLETGADGALETKSSLRLFSSDFDRPSLLTDNYIPLPTVLMRRNDFLDLNGFDPTFDLFEDWDFLIRLSGRGDFLHIPRITCEIRHIRNAGSITMNSPEGSAAFRQAKLQIWKKHASLLTPDVFADALEKSKQRLWSLQSDATEQRGSVHHLQREVDRLLRDTRIAAQQSVEAVIARDVAIAAGAAASETLRAELRTREAAIESQVLQLAALREEHGDLNAHFRESQTTIPALYAEIRRLQGLLDTIFASRTWKLHTLVQKAKGRG